MRKPRGYTKKGKARIEKLAEELGIELKGDLDTIPVVIQDGKPVICDLVHYWITGEKIPVKG